MRAIVESTDTITTIDGVPCRVWSGVTERGVPFFLFGHRVAVQVGDGNEAQFEEELRSEGAPAALDFTMPVVRARRPGTTEGTTRPGTGDHHCPPLSMELV